jgi:hypothetical protein
MNPVARMGCNGGIMLRLRYSMGFQGCWASYLPYSLVGYESTVSELNAEMQGDSDET